MVADTKNINLFADSHSVEVMVFSVILERPINHVDIRKFEDKINTIKKLYPSIESPSTIQFGIASQIQNFPPPPIPAKELNSYSADGKVEWSGLYHENVIQVSCHKYKGWKETWPKVKERLDILLSCLNLEKPIFSIDYRIINSFNAKKKGNVLNPCTLFKNSNKFIAPQILQCTDPRWDFNQGWFDVEGESLSKILVRIDGNGRLENNQVIANIGIYHSDRERSKVEVIAKQSNGQSKVDQIFGNFHSKSKELLKKLIASDLGERMNLNA
ncbi:MAG: TIGR04255 family protein [Aestuariivita sp.]|nr:TIGR04255 family protein [Aestuariivita sp.]